MQNIFTSPASEPRTRATSSDARVFSPKSFRLGFIRILQKSIDEFFFKRIDENSCARLRSAHLRCRSSALFRQPADTRFWGSIPSFELGNPPGLPDRRLHEKEPEKLQS